MACATVLRFVRSLKATNVYPRQCKTGHRAEEVRVVDPEWWGTTETVGWVRCRNCGAVLIGAKVVGDGPITKELWE